jgi:hypothetical protein
MPAPALMLGVFQVGRLIARPERFALMSKEKQS